MTMEDVKGVETPELDKMLALNKPSKPFDTLTNFADWLERNGYIVCQYGKPRERKVKCERCGGRKIDAEALTKRQKQLLHRGVLPDEEWPMCPDCGGDGHRWVEYLDEDSLAPVAEGWERFFARFWEIDLDAVSRERQSILEAIQRPEARQVQMKRCRTCQRRMDAGTPFCCETCEMLTEDVDDRVRNGAIPVLAKVMSHAPPHDDFRVGRNDLWVHFDVKVQAGNDLRGGWWHFGIWIETGKLYLGEEWGASEAMEGEPTDPEEAWLPPQTTVDEALAS